MLMFSILWDGVTYHGDWALLLHFKVLHERDEEDAKCVADPIQSEVANETGKDDADVDYDVKNGEWGQWLWSYR